MAETVVKKQESAIGAVLGWGGLAVFTIIFAWYIGAPLLTGEQWKDKKNDAIDLVKNSKPGGTITLYDMIRTYALAAKEQNVVIAEFKWDAIQREGPEYEVTLLWTEEGQKHVALWRVNLKDKSMRPQGDEAAGLVKRVESGPPTKAAQPG